MIRTDDAYWQRLRKDPASNIAAGSAVVCLLLAVFGMEAALPSQGFGRSHLSSWPLLLVLPIGWWTSGLTRFEPGSAGKIRLAQLAGPLACAAIAAWQGGTTATLVILALAVGCAALGRWSLRRSLLKREGPAR